MAAIRRAEAVRERDLRGGKGLDALRLAELARAAKDGCPVSRALEGSAGIDVRANLEQFQTKANWKENIMKTAFKSKDIEQLLAEADELLQQINSEVIEDMEEEQRAQIEAHVQILKEFKSRVQNKTEKDGTPESRAYSEGMHEAIEDIVKAIKGLASYLP